MIVGCTCVLSVGPFGFCIEYQNKKHNYVSLETLKMHLVICNAVSFLDLPFRDFTVVQGVVKVETVLSSASFEKLHRRPSELAVSWCPGFKGCWSAMLLKGAEELDDQLARAERGGSYSFLLPPPRFSFVLVPVVFFVLVVCWFNSVNLSELIQE